MKNHSRWLVWTAILISVQWATAVMAAEDKIRVMNPRGIRPAIERIPMAERPGTLEGKTIYIVDTKFANTKPFVNALQENLAEAYPETTWIGVEKKGGYMLDDPELWAEIKAKGDGAIVLLGH